MLGDSMKEYRREYPLFSLCGLNCGLCPRYQSKGKSRCPGCGGKDFCFKHPACSVIACNKRHDNVEYCFQCKSYPCEKYKNPSKVDSFVSYVNVKHDFEKCSSLGIDEYKRELNKKVNILELLLEKYNNGRLKNFYCIAVNFLELNDLEVVMKFISEELEKNDMSIDEKIQIIVSALKRKAQENNIDLKLRK
jgi:hypothetical protein